MSLSRGAREDSDGSLAWKIRASLAAALRFGGTQLVVHLPLAPCRAIPRNRITRWGRAGQATPHALPGTLLHLDGSRHRWVQDDRWYDLIEVLDNATNETYYAQLVEEESTRTRCGLRWLLPVSRHRMPFLFP